MQKDTNNLSIIAYYLSKYDRATLSILGYSTMRQALQELSALFGPDNNYLKLRRDEFDVVTGSHRKGWRNREPAKSVIRLATVLDNYSFEELSVMVKDLIIQKGSNVVANPDIETLNNSVDEVSLEDLLNGHISTARLDEVVRKSYQRIYNVPSLEKLKRHYQYKCQICGINAGEEYGTDIAEIHHIVPFSVSQDNSIGNLIVLCPNHHRLLHKGKAEYDSEAKSFRLVNGKLVRLVLNDHL